MRVLILGGTGLIGRALAANLAADRNEVIVLSRSPERQRGRMSSGVEVAGWDGRTSAGWADRITGSTAIVNLAGENLAGGRWTAERKRSLMQSRIDPGHAVVAANEAAAAKPRGVVQASAIGYYGPNDKGDLNETSPAGDDFPARVCAEWEASTAALDRMGVRRVISRTAIVLDGRMGALPRMMLPFRFFIGGPLGDGSQPISWIHIQDEVAALRFLMETESAVGPFNLSSPQLLTNAEFGRILGRVMRRPSFVPTPGFALRLAFGEMASVLLTGPRVFPRRLLDLGFAFRFPDADKALSDVLK
jgi:uncharacterized protein (TIGR01777 family)